MMPESTTRGSSNGQVANQAGIGSPTQRNRTRPHQPRPIFAIGAQRSGASLLALALGQHERIAFVPDATWLESLTIGMQAVLDEDAARQERSQLAAMGITGDCLFAQFGAAIDQLMIDPRQLSQPERAAPPSDGPPYTWRDFGNGPDRHAQAGAPYCPERWVDGCYTHTFIVHSLRRLFPAAQFIHVIRDVHENVAALIHPVNASVYKSRHVPFTVRDAYEHWIDATTACVEAEQALGPGDVLRVRWQDMTADPQGTVQRCLRFLGEPFDPACLCPLSPARGASGASAHGDDGDSSLQELRRQAEALSFALLSGGPRV